MLHLLCKAEDNAGDNITTSEEKKQSRKLLEIEKDVAKLYTNKGDKVENKNKWKRMSSKKCAHKSNNKWGQTRRRKTFNMNRFSELQKILGDDNEIHEVIREAALQDKN